MRIRDDRELEDQVNEELRLTPTKNSGAVHNDGDGKGRSKEHDSWEQVMNDSKFTIARRGTVSFKKKEFEKTALSARRHGRLPIMTTYQLGDDEVYVHITLDDFARIYKNHLAYTKRTT
jgi:hypothetical protein